LIILNRFKTFVHTDSIAVVKRKFGVTGDAYVEIQRGRAGLVSDGDWLSCRKDEEIMETAQQFIAEFKEAVLPLLADFRQLIERSNRIAGAIDSSEGLVGSIVGDETLATDVKQIVRNMDDLLVRSQATLDDTHRLVARINESLEQEKGLLGAALNDERLLQEVQDVIGKMNRLMDDVTAGLTLEQGLAGSVLYDRELAERVITLLDDFSDLTYRAQVTFEDVDQLVLGAQRHWLLRKYVPGEEEDQWLYPGQYRGREASLRLEGLALALDRARSMNNGLEVAHAAVNLAALLLPDGDEEEINGLLLEARAEFDAAGESSVRTRLLEAELARSGGDAGQALALLDSWLPRADSADRELRLYGALLRADLLCDLGRFAEAGDALDPGLASSGRIASRYLPARVPAIQGRILMGEGNATLAAERFDQAATLAREAGSFLAMAEQLEYAGAAHEKAGNESAAADRYFRASRTIYYGGIPGRAWRVLERALPRAEAAGDELQLSRINRLREEIEANRE